MVVEIFTAEKKNGSWLNPNINGSFIDGGNRLVRTQGTFDRSDGSQEVLNYSFQADFLEDENISH